MQPLFKVIKYSHFFAVRDIQPTGIGILLNFSVRYVQKTFVREGGKSVLKPTRVFGTRIEGGEFRYHIGQYKDFLWYLGNIGISEDLIQVIEEPLYDAKDTATTVNPKFEEREYQTNIIKFLTNEEIGDNHSRLVALQTGGGKLQPVTTPVKVPGGWRPIGSLRVGDTVTAWDGTPSKVIGVYRHGVQPILKVTFADGRSTECGYDHLWKVYREQWNHQTLGKWRVIDTRELIKIVNDRRSRRNYIPLAMSEQIDDIELPIDPYILGTLIGDGSFCGKAVTLTTPDNFIVNYFEKNLPKTLKIVQNKSLNRPAIHYRIRRTNKEMPLNTYIDILKELKLHNCRSYEKFIPNIYLNASTNQRLKLLQGLLDTDGYVNEHSTVSYTTSSRQLADDVQYLVRSLGGIAKITTKEPFFTYKRERKQGRLSYTVCIRHKSPEDLLTLPKKKIRCNNNHQYSDGLKLRIEKVEYVDNKEAVCIAIDHPDRLYITNDFIVTHNTFVSLAATSKLTKRTMIIVLPKYLPKWTADVAEILDVKPKEILTIQGGKDLKSMLWLSTEQDIGAKFIVISLTTIQNYYNDFKDHGKDIEAMGYPYSPEEMFKHLGIGTLIFDEVHQHLYGVYRVLLHTHVPKVIALSATLISDDPFIDKMQQIMFPKEIRYNKVPINRYVRVRVYSYGVQDRKTIDKLRTTARGSNTYSHIEYEKSIMKFSPLLNNYLSIVSDILRQNYIDTKEPGDKAIVFAASIAMCNQILHRLKKDYPRLDIRRYVEDDPYENVIEADVRVSTILSAGTAVDIPNLTVAIMTNSVQSPVANLQALGRLRKLKDKEVTFCYIYNYHIKKQTEYHYKKKELFADRAVTIKEFRLDEGL